MLEPRAKPINKQPIIFTSNVAMGNELNQTFSTRTVNEYLNIAPKPPPRPINMTFVI